ncbi:PAS domain S-box protein [Pseudoalteromonas sp. GB56]
MNTAVDGIVTITDKGKVLSFNAGAERILGYTSDEVVGNNVKMLMPDDIAIQHDHFLARYKETKERNIIGYGREVLAQHKNGHTLPIHLGVGEVALPDKKIMFVGFITDLSEHKKMQQQLAAQEHHYRTLINNMPGVAFRCRLDKYWSMVYISPIVESLTGYTDEEFVNGHIHFSDLIDPEFEESLREKIYNAIALEQSDYSFEYQIKTKSGKQKWILDKGTFEPDDTNEMCIAGVLVDISERKSMEQQLIAAKDKAEAAAETKQAFLANMSHEIRTPMNSIIGFSEVLLDSPLSKNQRHQLTNVLQSARSLLHLLNDILDSAKLEQGKVSIERIPFDLLALCDSVVSSFYHQAQRKGLTLDMQLDASLATYYEGDPQRIRQVLINLLGNALKFTEQGRVALQVVVAGKGVRFVISDTGIGIAPERINAIFMPFEQADDSTTRRFGGTGLGTTICRQLVNLMGGDIDVQSTLGAGSEFSFNLPLSQASDEQVSELQQQSSTTNKLPKMPTLHILIADDVAQNRELLELRLGNLGHKTQVAVNGEEAVAKATSEHFDVVLMDIHMPICDGLEATARLRQHERETGAPATVVIALTASVLQSDREAARKAGMDSFATKPVVVDDLMCDVARLLDIQVDVANENIVQHSVHTGNISVNEEKGVNLWGTLELYIHQLQQFYADRARDVKALSHFDQLDDEQLMLVHTLKGLAGNLCLPNLSAQLNDIERQGKVTDEHRFALFSCLDEIDGYLQHHPLTHVTPAQVSVANVSVLKQLLPHIQELCDNFEYDSDSCEQLQEAAGQQFMDDVEKIIELINEFEFDKAKQHIATLVSQLESFDDE